MSKAFTKEGDERVDVLPERPVSPHPNLVTVEGLAAIEAEILRLQASHTGPKGESNDTLAAHAARDLRYWQSRRETAQLIEDTAGTHVKFGSRVTIVREDGVEKTYKIVGVDEADPKNGSVSYISPLAQEMMGKGAGDTFKMPSHEFTIVRVS